MAHRIENKYFALEAPFSPNILKTIQQGLLNSPFTPKLYKKACAEIIGENEQSPYLTNKSKLTHYRFLLPFILAAAYCLHAASRETVPLTVGSVSGELHQETLQRRRPSSSENRQVWFLCGRVVFFLFTDERNLQHTAYHPLGTSEIGIGRGQSGTQARID